VVDDLPKVPVRVGEERIRTTQRGRRRRLDDHAAGPGRLLDRRVDLAVGGHMDGEDGLALGLAGQRGGHLLTAELGKQRIVAYQQEAAGVLNIDMAGVDAGDSSQPRAV
jgi:hypothetical protein